MRHRPVSLPLSSVVFASFLVPALFSSGALAQTVRERVSVEAVTVTVRARNGSGRPVPDLRATDLSLFVDGKPVAIDTFIAEPQAAAVPAAPASVPAPQPGALEPSAPTASTPNTTEIAIVADESSTNPFDRWAVYDQLSKFLNAPHSAARRYLVAKFTVRGLAIECPWTSDPETARAALSRLRVRPAAGRIPSPGEVDESPPLSGLEIGSMQKRFFSALLEALAAFSDTSSRRELILVSGGLLLQRPEDVAHYVTANQPPADRIRRSSRQAREFLKSQEPDRQRETFQLWTRAVSGERLESLTTADLVAKANERDVVLVPIGAEAPDRGVNPGVSLKSPPVPPVLGSAIGPRTSTVQAMTYVAEETGGEPVLVPRKAAARLAEIEDRSSFALTFLAPGGADHRFHSIDIACRRAGVRLDYRRGYRIATEEERTLDRVVAAFRQPAQQGNPLSATASLAPAISNSGRSVTRLSLRFQPPPERGLGDDRAVELVAVGEDTKGNRTEPVRWSGTAGRLDEAGIFALSLDLGVPAGGQKWSLGLRDQPTGLVSYLTMQEGETAASGLGKTSAREGELPFRVTPLKVVRQGGAVHGTIHAALDAEEILNALDGRKGRVHFQIVTKLPSNPRVVLLDSEGAVAEDADEWTWDVPLTWSADTLRMTILAEEMITGLKASATLDPSSWK